MTMHRENEARKMTAIRLYNHWHSHNHDDCAALNTVLAVFGVSKEPPVRTLMKSRYMNPPYHMWLEDIAWLYGGRREEFTSSGGDAATLPTATARNMVLNRLTRRGRCVTMTASARQALLDYYNELLELLREVEQFAVSEARENHEKRPYDSWLIGRHITAVSGLLQLIEGV